MLSLISTVCVLAQLSSGTVLPSHPETHDNHVPNANHIFNSIHSSMRQWGSSLYHNGMSFFIATVPASTQFYHGAHENVTITGTEWLAFEPEHSLYFARAIHFPPKRPGKKPPGDGSKGPGQISHPTQKNMHITKEHHGLPPGYEVPGWLHSYITTRDLRLLYIDGMSAAKTDIGTLDSQDSIILNISSGTSSRFPLDENSKPPTSGGGNMGDNDRAALLCAKARNEWDGRIDGFLRMETGFEIILCDFSATLDLASITRVKHSDSDPDSEEFSGGPDELSVGMAVASRYHGIGGDRVSINYNDFVSAWTYDLGAFQEARLRNVSQDVRDAIRDDLDALIMRDQIPGRDWQRIADLVVDRYAARLQNMLAAEDPRTELGFALQPFIDYDNRSSSEELSRCVRHIAPMLLTPQDSTAGQAIQATVQRICGDMVRAAAEKDAEDARVIVKELVSWLGWSTWKECMGCEWNEICYLPMWPHGDVEDYEKPNCKGREELERVGGSYWPREWR